MRNARIVAALIVLCPALFLRSYSLPPAPDRRGGTTILLALPDRPLFGSPRADCLGVPEDGSVIACLIASVNRARTEGVTLLSLPFSPTAYGLSERLAGLGRDPGSTRAQADRIARLGW